MKVYTCTNFTGHYPVGTAAVIVANNKEHAKKLLRIELVKNGLYWTGEETVERIYYNVWPQKGQVVILNDGNY